MNVINCLNFTEDNTYLKAGSFVSNLFENIKDRFIMTRLVYCTGDAAYLVFSGPFFSFLVKLNLFA